MTINTTPEAKPATKPLVLWNGVLGSSKFGRPTVIRLSLRVEFVLLKLQPRILWLSTRAPVEAVKPT